MAILQRDCLILRAIREDETSDANAIMNGSMTSGNDYDNSTSDSNNTTTDDTNNETPTEDNSDDGNQTNNNDDTGGDDDFNIDTSLDGTDDSNSDDSSSSELSSSSTTYSSDSDDGEVNNANTDIYSSFTAEEQAQKIVELKNQYKELYTACNEFLIKLNDVDVDDRKSIVAMGKVSKTVYNLKNYIKDYFMNTFPYVSIIQNDTMYQRFLLIMNSIPGLLDDVRKNDEKSDHNN